MPFSKCRPRKIEKGKICSMSLIYVLWSFTVFAIFRYDSCTERCNYTMLCSMSLIYVLWSFTLFAIFRYDSCTERCNYTMLCSMSLIYVLWSFTFYCMFPLYAEFFMFALFYLYIVRNDNNKDDQSYNKRVPGSHRTATIWTYDDRVVHCHTNMTSSNRNILRVTGHLCGQFTGNRWIAHTKASDAELWCFLWSTPEHTVE